jgi:hypothetical protein
MLQLHHHVLIYCIVLLRTVKRQDSDARLACFVSDRFVAHADNLPHQKMPVPINVLTSVTEYMHFINEQKEDRFIFQLSWVVLGHAILS